jgi:hypothetical protein
MDTLVFNYFQLYIALTKSYFPRISHDKVNKTGSILINVTTRRVRVTAVAVEKSNTLHISSISYLARTAHAPYYVSHV